MIGAFLALFPVAAATPGEAAEYARVVAGETAEVRVYDGWYTALLLRGTRMTTALRAAQAARLSELTGGAGTLEVPEGIEIVLSASTQFTKELKFSATGETPWTILLSAGGKACAPALEVVAEKKVSPEERTLLPHITDWDKVFRVHYAADACGGAEPDALRVVGARGEGTLRWSD
ncbi:hypothetical protein LBMAG42_02570 [Deltaproteobacteria bacterium]|nr:hypothetical protein LBMAG42_02570 [Deltaproteobacteria bacterium]